MSENQNLQLCQLIDNNLKSIDEHKKTIFTLQKKVRGQEAVSKTYQNSSTQTQRTTIQ